MAAVTGLTIVKKMTYRGNANEEWSNQYWFTGSVPADNTAWDALFAALVAAEKTCYQATHHVVAGYGYNSDADDAHAVYVKDVSAAPIAGTMGTTGMGPAPGDAAGMIAWKTSRTNSRGKAIYLRKYLHGVLLEAAPDEDKVAANQLTVYNTFATKLYDGSFLDGRKLRSRKHDETLLTHAASQWVTTRTLKRRGKRPS